MKKLLSVYFALAFSLITCSSVYAVVDINAQLINALWMNNIPKVKETLSLGANVNAYMDIVEEGGVTPLMVAAATPDSSIEIGKLLLDRGAKVNAKDSLGWTPLMYASYNGLAELAKLLMSKGADVNAISKVGWTPLMYAAYKGQAALGILLIENGADLNAKTRKGETALSIAESRGENDFVEFLRQKPRGPLRTYPQSLCDWELENASIFPCSILNSSFFDIICPGR